MTGPIAKAEMLIRRPVSNVFAAFADPKITTRFWFTKSSGPLEAGKTVRWEWEMYGMAMEAEVKVLEKDRRILLAWSAYGGSEVEWIFTPRADGTFVSISHKGFAGSAAEQTEAAVGSTEGFTLVLAGAKALLEHGIELKLVHDRFPDANVTDKHVRKEQ